MARVGIDIDGVIANFHVAFIQYAIDNNWIGDEFAGHEPDRWEFYLDLGLSKEDYAKIMQDGANEIFANCPVLDDAKDALIGLFLDGHKIILVTNRYSSSRNTTMKWLLNQGIPFDELHHVADKTKIELDFFVDDKPENVRALNAAEVCAYLMDQNWNGDAYGLDRVFGLHQYRTAVNKICNLNNHELLQEHPRTRLFQSIVANTTPAAEAAEPLTGEVRMTSSTGGEKGVKPAQFQSIPSAAILELASHYAKGAAKYSDHNFRKGYPWSSSYSALLRHLLAFWGGEDIDEETGSKHVIAVAWHALTLATFMDEHPNFDDRYKGENQ